MRELVTSATYEYDLVGYLRPWHWPVPVVDVLLLFHATGSPVLCQRSIGRDLGVTSDNES